jgi:prefoldin subunit 5
MDLLEQYAAEDAIEQIAKELENLPKAIDHMAKGLDNIATGSAFENLMSSGSGLAIS